LVVEGVKGKARGLKALGYYVEDDNHVNVKVGDALNC